MQTFSLPSKTDACGAIQALLPYCPILATVNKKTVTVFFSPSITMSNVCGEHKLSSTDLKIKVLPGALKVIY